MGHGRTSLWLLAAGNHCAYKVCPLQHSTTNLVERSALATVGFGGREERLTKNSRCFWGRGDPGGDSLVAVWNQGLNTRVVTSLVGLRTGAAESYWPTCARMAHSCCLLSHGDLEQGLFLLGQLQPVAMKGRCTATAGSAQRLTACALESRQCLISESHDCQVPANTGLKRNPLPHLPSLVDTVLQ
jgi:hypothetical protein